MLVFRKLRRGRTAEVATSGFLLKLVSKVDRGIIGDEARVSQARWSLTF